MAKTPDDQRLELLHGTLDTLILRTLQLAPAWPRDRPGPQGAVRRPPEVRDRLVVFLLDRLVKRGWLKAEWGVSEANQCAKYYHLTAAGNAQLLREQNRWSQLVHAIGRIMNPAAEGKNEPCRQPWRTFGRKGE